MITSKEFAKIIGMSQSTVSRAMNGSHLVPEEKRQYIQRKAEEYGFVLNSQARSLKTNKTYTLGVLFPILFESLSKNMMLTHIYDILQRELSKSEYDIMVVFDNGEKKTSAFERIIKSRKVDGFVVLRPRLSERENELLDSYHVPWVALFAAVQNPAKPNQFVIDSEQAGFVAGDFYGRQDDRDYIFLTINDSKTDAKLRKKGFERGLKAHGKTLDAKKILRAQISVEGAYQIIIRNKELFLHRKTAIFAHNDMMALGVIGALRDIGVSIPQQAEVIGVDGIPHGEWFRPCLTTIRAPLENMVYDACECLYRLMRGEEDVPKQRILYSCVLVQRDTTEKEGN